MMKAISTPKERFSKIQDFPYQENYVDFEGMQMHYVDEGKGETILALHGEPTWSYLYRKFIPVLTPEYRFIAPDLIGFGKSDKIIGWKNYSLELHFNSLKNLIDKLDLHDITLVVQDWGGILGLSLLAEYPERFKQIIILNTFLPVGKPLKPFFKLWQSFARFHPSLPISYIIQKATHQHLSKEVLDAYKAPFPDRRYKGGAKAFPLIVPGKPTADGVKRIAKAREVLAKWKKPAFIMFSDKDQVLGGLEKFFYSLIPTSKEQQKIVIENAGHFLQEEKGEQIAMYIQKFMKGEMKI